MPVPCPSRLRGGSLGGPPPGLTDGISAWSGNGMAGIGSLRRHPPPSAGLPSRTASTQRICPAHPAEKTHCPGGTRAASTSVRRRPWKTREISGMALRTPPMKEMVQRPFMGRVGHAGGLLDKLRHLTRLGNKGRVGALDRFGRCVHPLGHESLRLRSYPIVLLRNEIPRWNRFPAGSSGLFLQRGTCYWTLGDSHHIRHITGCVCAESLVKLVSLDVQLWPADGTRRVIIGKIGCSHYHWWRKRLLYAGNTLAHVQADGGQEDQSSYVAQFGRSLTHGRAGI